MNFNIFSLLEYFPECIATLGTANFRSMRSWAAISATISIGGWTLDVGVDRQGARRLVSARQNGFIGLLQEGELEKIFLDFCKSLH